jgi:hypothetical protein
VQLRKQKREDMIMKRRGLNFITDQHEQNLDMESINTIEKEVDNVAPKIIGILPLSETCDTSYLRNQLVDYCVNYMDELNTTKKGKMIEDLNIDRSN